MVSRWLIGAPGHQSSPETPANADALVLLHIDVAKPGAYQLVILGIRVITVTLVGIL